MSTNSGAVATRRVLFACALGLVLNACPVAQSALRCWGFIGYDTSSREGRCIQVDASGSTTIVLRADGRVFANGQNAYGLIPAPVPPAGQKYISMAACFRAGAAIRSDGQIDVWGADSNNVMAPVIPPTLPPAPALPPGLRYLQVAVYGQALALRSDGVIVAWGINSSGECNVPPLPPGTSVVKLRAGNRTSYAILSDGSILAWGGNHIGQLAIPPLPAGVGYVDIQQGYDHCVAVRTDGQLVAWGSNQYGQLNIPALPAGTSYVMASAGWGHTQAVRSDNVIVAWGTGTYGELDVPTLPPGVRCLDIDSGYSHTAALLSDGSIVTWGQYTADQGYLPCRKDAALGPGPLPNYRHVARGVQHTVAVLSNGVVQAWGYDLNGQCDVPATLAGRVITKVAADSLNSAALTDDGEVTCWGDNAWGQCNVPPLPAGLVYTDVALGDRRTVLIRSDGQAFLFGMPIGVVGPIPALPSGVRYVQCDVQWSRVVLVRSDGVVTDFGFYGVPTIPAPPSGVGYVKATASMHYGAGLLSDGTVRWWGSLGGSWGGAIWEPIPPLPTGVYYVDVDGGGEHTALRRSDGQVVVCGYVHDLEGLVPPLDPGTSYMEISAEDAATVGRVGPTSTYVGLRPGCAGSMPATRLVPRDTPRIGHTLQVTLFDLPVDIAAMAMSFQQLPSPLSLGFLGMPGCSWHIPLDAIVLLSGQNNQAKFLLPIPDQPSLIGVHFFHQAVVLDPAVGGGFGAVVSDVAEGVVGDW